MHETMPHEKPVESYRALLPRTFVGAEHVRRGIDEYLKVSHDLAGYGQLDPTLVDPLVAGGLILPVVEQGSGVDYYAVPEGAQSLSGFLNSTFADNRGEEKRELVLTSISERLKQLASHGIAIEKASGFTRFDLCLGERLMPVLLPLGTSIYETDNVTALQKNGGSYKELLTDIIAEAAPEEIEFLKQQRDKWGG